MYLAYDSDIEATVFPATQESLVDILYEADVFSTSITESKAYATKLHDAITSNKIVDNRKHIKLKKYSILALFHHTGTLLYSAFSFLTVVKFYVAGAGYQGTALFSFAGGSRNFRNNKLEFITNLKDLVENIDTNGDNMQISKLPLNVLLQEELVSPKLNIFSLNLENSLKLTGHVSGDNYLPSYVSYLFYMLTEDSLLEDDKFYSIFPNPTDLYFYIDLLKNGEYRFTGVEHSITFLTTTLLLYELGPLFGAKAFSDCENAVAKKMEPTVSIIDKFVKNMSEDTINLTYEFINWLSLYLLNGSFNSIVYSTPEEELSRLLTYLFIRPMRSVNSKDFEVIEYATKIIELLLSNCDYYYSAIGVAVDKEQ